MVFIIFYMMKTTSQKYCIKISHFNILYYRSCQSQTENVFEVRRKFQKFLLSIIILWNYNNYTVQLICSISTTVINVVCKFEVLINKIE